MSDAPAPDRRDFLKTAAATVGAAALASGPRLLRAQNLNKRVGIAVIGCGGISHHLVKSAFLPLREKGEVDIVGVCDVFDPRAEEMAKLTGAKPCRDYRKLLEDKGVDVVYIGTPDHWHSKITMDAAEAGKDVYCEKPMTHWRNLDEARNVVRTIERTKRVMQVGTHRMSDNNFVKSAELIRAGALGQLVHAQASDCRNVYFACYDPLQKDDSIKPGVNLDWDMWLGPAAKVPFDLGRFLAFRVFWDYSGGLGTDLFPHLLTPLVQMMDLRFPSRCVSSGGNYFFRQGWEVPDVFSATWEYPNGPSLHLMANMANDTNLDMQIRGRKGTLTVHGEPGASITIESQEAKPGEKRAKTELPPAGGGVHRSHFEDFLACVKSRDKKPRSHEKIGYQVMIALHMGIRSWREGKVLTYDEAKDEVKAL